MCASRGPHDMVASSTSRAVGLRRAESGVVVDGTLPGITMCDMSLVALETSEVEARVGLPTGELGLPTGES